MFSWRNKKSMWISPYMELCTLIFYHTYPKNLNKSVFYYLLIYLKLLDKLLTMKNHDQMLYLKLAIYQRAYMVMHHPLTQLVPAGPSSAVGSIYIYV